MWLLDPAVHFPDTGTYQVLFYGKAAGADTLTPGKTTWVYRGTGLSQPAAFTLIPPDGGSSIIAREHVFQWETSHSDLGQVQYLFQLWHDASGQIGEIYWEGPLGGVPFLALDPTVLEDGVYWWNVIAVDPQGNTTRSTDVLQIIVNATNDVPAFLAGQVYDDTTRQPIVGVTLQIDDADPFALPNSVYAKPVTTGTYTLTVSAPHYESMIETVEVTGDVLTTDFALKFTGQTMPLPLRAGWNLISFPLLPVDTSVGAVFANPDSAGEVVNSRPVYEWAGDNYEEVDTVAPFLGYWVYCEREMVLQVRGSVPENSPRNLSVGWNLVGPSVYRSVPQSRGPDLTWLTWEGQTYKSPESEAAPFTNLLRSKFGYWVYTSEAQPVNLGDETQQ